MPIINQIRYTTQTASSSERERRRSEEGTTYRDVLNDELCVNPDKFTVLVNGVAVTDLDVEVRENDHIQLQPKKYSSGAVAA